LLSRGTVAASSVARTAPCDLALGSPRLLEPALGVEETVGNRPDGSVGETPVPEIAGSLPGAGSVTDELGVDVGAATIRSDAEPVNESAL
jgi:hypothetical protein